MQAIVIDQFNEAGSIRQMPEPELERNAVLIRVNVAGVNPVDWKIRAGEAGEREFPLVLGQDFAGVIEAVGENVERVAPGDRVFGIARDHGSFAQETLVTDLDKASPFIKIPDGIDDRAAAALPIPALTALASLDALGVTEGTELLVIGAAGAVGTAALQMARKRRAKITAVVRPGQAGIAREFGATTVIEAESDFLEPVRAAHPAAFPAVLDVVSTGAELQHHLPLYAKGGTVVTTIHVADTDWFREHEIDAINLVMAETDASSPRGLETLAELVLAGDLKVEPVERPMVEAASVLDQMQAGQLDGKVVLRIDPDA